VLIVVGLLVVLTAAVMVVFLLAMLVEMEMMRSSMVCR